MRDFATEEALIAWLEEIRGWSRSSLPATLAEQIHYGESPEQVIDLWQPAAGEADRLVVSVHGGGFTAEYAREINEPLVRGLTALGFAVANLEYRRIGSGGGVETTTGDVDAALATLAARDDVGVGGFAVVGHSAGGYLALWSAASPAVELAVALAPVVDLAAMHRDDETIVEWVGGTPEQEPASYRRGDLARRLPTGTQIVLMHGEADESVPVEQSASFRESAERAGEPVRLEVFDDEGHFGWLDPRLPASRALQSVLTGWRERSSTTAPGRG